MSSWDRLFFNDTCTLYSRVFKEIGIEGSHFNRGKKKLGIALHRGVMLATNDVTQEIGMDKFLFT